MLLLVDDVFVVVAPLLLLVLVPLFFGTSTFIVTPYALVLLCWHWRCCFLALALLLFGAGAIIVVPLCFGVALS